MAVAGATHLAASALFSIGNRRPWPRLAVPPPYRASMTSSPSPAEDDDELKGSAAVYLEEAKALIRAADGGPPRWFSPVKCSASGTKRLMNAPTLLYLPGLDGVGLGLTRHHKKLAKMFEVWCLHIPVMDRTSFTDLVKWIENTIREEHKRSPSRPIYLVGESLGACLAMVVAAHNPHIDLLLILANPENIFLEPQAFENLSSNLQTLSNISTIAEILPRETLWWKMELLKLAASHANSRLHAIKAQTLILTSGMDPLLPSQEEGQRLHNLLPACEVRRFCDSSHFLFLENGVDIVTAIKATAFYRRKRNRDLVADYVQIDSSEFSKERAKYRWYDVATSPVIYSTLENGQILVFDYDDYMRIPYLKKQVEDLTNKLAKLRTDMTGDVANQAVHLPGFIPKPPGRLYFLMGKTIDTKERKEELKDRDKAQELYLHVKSEVQTCLDYLKANRQRDPYRNILARTLYQVVNGFTSEVPAFDP